MKSTPATCVFIQRDFYVEGALTPIQNRTQKICTELRVKIMTARDIR